MLDWARTGLVMSTISKRKQKRSDIEAYYRNESKTFWFVPLKNWTEAERFGLVRIFLYRKQFVSVLAHRFWAEANQFDLVQKLSEERSYVIKKRIDRSKVLIWFPYYWSESKTFWFGLLIFRTEEKYFDLVCLLSELKQNILIWSAYYLN